MNRLSKTVTGLSLVACSLVFTTAIAKAESAVPGTQPAKAYPLAEKSLLLDIKNTGAGLIAAGTRGHILRSEDGSSWEQVVVPVDSLLTSVSFADGMNGWVVGHDATILHTTDGGKSWTLQHFNPESGPLLDVAVASASEAYAVGSFGTFLSTRDGGKTWGPHEAPAVTDAGVHLYSIQRFPNGRWVTVGEMGFVAATDAEGEWQVLTSPYDGSFYSVAAVGEAGAIAVGMRGNAYVTDDLDAGDWRKLETGTLMGLTSVARLPSGRFAITGINRTLLVADVGGHVRSVKVPGEPDEMNTGSYNAMTIMDGQVFLASDEGVKLAIKSRKQ